MKIECVDAVQQAIGRTLTQTEQRGIENRVRGAMRRLASREPEKWRTMPRADRIREAGRIISEDLQHAAELRSERAALQVEAHARHLPDVEQAGRQGFEVLQLKLTQAERLVNGVYRQYLVSLLDTIDHATRNDSGSLVQKGVRWISNLENPERTLAFAREVYGQSTGDPGAAAAAKAWRETDEAMRVRFNRAGGDIRKLSTAHLPQPHDAGRMTEAGITTWVQDTLRLVDRRRYTDARGRMLGDRELADVLGQVYRDIITDGLANRELGIFQAEGSLANAGSQARVLHLKDGDAHVAYLAKYGQGTVFDALSGHVRWMARNIGMVEELGPNPAATFRTLHDAARLGGGKDSVGLLNTTQDMFDTLAGKFDNPHNQTLARINQGVRSTEVSGKLGGATIGALSDIGYYFLTLGYNRLPMMHGLANLIRGWQGSTTHYANVAGLMGDSLVGDLARFGEVHLGRNWPDMLANATMKVTLLNAVTNAGRRALGVAMMAGLGKLSRVPWEQLDKYDRARLQTAGWRPEEWGALQAVPLEDWRGSAMLTPAAILRAEGIDPALRDSVVSRLIGHIDSETRYASPDPNLKTRTVQAGGMQRGTGRGELWRHLMLFKGYSLSIIFRHWERALKGDMSPASKVAYTAALVLAPTLLGGIALQVGDLVAGRDPRDMTGNGGEDPEMLLRFWVAALAKGGGLGFLGDMLLSGVGSQGQSGASAAVGAITGPVVGSAFELVYDVGMQNAIEAAQGKETHAGAEAFRWVRSHTPGVNIWYARTVLDHAVLNEAQEFLSPGYLNRQRSRMEANWGATWYWPIEDTGAFTGDMEPPERLPAFGNAIGLE